MEKALTLATERTLSATKVNDPQLLALLSDEPIGDLENERLDVDLYAGMISAAVLGTEGPFTIGVFGHWGYGKTSLLRLSRSLVDNSKTENVATVWFNAWQYEKEGHPIVPLVATIVQALETQFADTVKGKIKKGALELIRSLRAVAYGFSAKSSLKIPGLAEVEAGFVAKEMIDRDEHLRKQSVDPLLDKSLYYNAFQLLERTVTEENPDRPKVIVFIDDLDRCLPRKALHLLESIKLVLAQPGFVFVLAVDRRVLESYLDRRFRDEFGLDEYQQGQSYLDKIIQLSFVIPDHSRRFEVFARKTLARGELAVFKSQFESLVPIVGTACGFNPRQVIRFFNGLLVSNFIWRSVNPDTPFDVGAFAVARSLQDQDEKVYQTLLNRPDLCQALNQGKESTLERLRAMNYEDHPNSSTLKKLGTSTLHWDKSTSDVVARLMERPHLCSLFDTEPGQRWLKDPDLRRIISRFDRIVVHRQPSVDESVLGRPLSLKLREAVNKPSGPLDIEDLAKIESIRLVGVECSGVRQLSVAPNLSYLYLENCSQGDFDSISTLTSLARLNVQSSPIQDLSALSGMANLHALTIFQAAVEDLAPVGKLTNLRVLDLGFLETGDLGSLATLGTLQELVLHGRRFSDLAPIQTLTQLRLLGLYLTGIQDLRFLPGLVNIESLLIYNTRLSGIEELAGLTKLRSLDLEKTQIDDISPLAGLSNLVTLHLGGTMVADLSPLYGLSKLSEVNIRNCSRLSAREARALRKALPDLKVSNE